MKCLDDREIQAIADGNASPELLQHAASCAPCARRISARQQTMDDLVTALDAVEMPPHLNRRIETMLAAVPAGATRVRDTSGSSRHRAFWSGALAVAATLAAILVIAPLITTRTALSAAEILAASAGRLGEAPETGVELLEYELALDGVPLELMPDPGDGLYRVRKAIDHDLPGRFRFSTYAPDGRLLSSIAEDPAAAQRVTLVRVDEQLYRFEFSLPADGSPSLVEIERLHMQASIGMMQASGDQHLTIVDTSSGRAYRIDVPRVSGDAGGRVWDLAEARALISANDYRLLELSVKGSFLERPYSVSFRLIDHVVTTAGNVPDGEFDVPDEPGALTLQGEGTAIPLRDTVVTALRALGRTQQRR